MKIFGYFQRALVLSVLAALTAFSSGCDYINLVLSKDKVNQGAILYNRGSFKEAQVFFREATDLNPKSTVAWLFLGATLVKDYKEVEGDEKVKLANEALDVYKKALDLSKGSCGNYNNAISYIATIYDDLGNTDEWRNWMLRRAEGECATNKAEKATTYYSVAVKYWQCSYDQTTRYQEKGAQDPFHYRNMDYPAALPDKQKAEECVAKGFEYIEKAIGVDAEYVDAMFYKALLYREQQKLTKDEAKRKTLAATATKVAEDASKLMKIKEAEAAKAAVPEG